jgi:hypothetical protein
MTVEWMATNPREAFDTRLAMRRNVDHLVRQRVRGYKGRIACKIDGRWGAIEDACIGHVHNKRSAAHACAAREARARNRMVG